MGNELKGKKKYASTKNTLFFSSPWWAIGKDLNAMGLTLASTILEREGERERESIFVKSFGGRLEAIYYTAYMSPWRFLLSYA